MNKYKAQKIRDTWDELDDGEISIEMLFSLVSEHFEIGDADVAEALRLTKNKEEDDRLAAQLKTARKVIEFYADKTNGLWGNRAVSWLAANPVDPDEGETAVTDKPICYSSISSRKICEKARKHAPKYVQRTAWFNEMIHRLLLTTTTEPATCQQLDPEKTTP